MPPAVAERMRSFGMEILAYDPYVTSARAQQMGARLLDLDSRTVQDLSRTMNEAGLMDAGRFRHPVARAAVGGLVTAVREAQLRRLKKLKAERDNVACRLSDCRGWNLIAGSARSIIRDSCASRTPNFTPGRRNRRW